MNMKNKNKNTEIDYLSNTKFSKNEVHIKPIESIAYYFLIFVCFCNLLTIFFYYVIKIDSIKKILEYTLTYPIGIIIGLLGIVYILVLQLIIKKEIIIDNKSIRFISKNKVNKEILYTDITNIIETRIPSLIISYNTKDNKVKKDKFYLYSINKEKVIKAYNIIYRNKNEGNFE